MIRRVWTVTVHTLASIPVAVLVCELATRRADKRRDGMAAFEQAKREAAVKW